MKSLAFMAILVLFVIGSWIGNFVKLLDCDFQSDYKCEVVHTIGIVPMLAPFTVWVDSDEPKL